MLTNEKEEIHLTSECNSLPDVIKNDDYIELDFDHYSYLIVFGSEVKKLTWNVWDTWDPILFFGEGRKWGTLTYHEDFDCNKIYVYRFPHEAIENHDKIKWA